MAQKPLASLRDCMQLTQNTFTIKSQEVNSSRLGFGSTYT